MGSASSVSSLMFDATPTRRVSIIGDSPLTVIVSATVPTFSVMLRSMVVATDTSRPSSLYVLKPDSEVTSVYNPGASCPKRYSPFSFVTVVTGPDGSAGEVSVIVTPGNTAFDASLIDPIMLPVRIWACAVAADTSVTSDAMTANVRCRIGASLDDRHTSQKRIVCEEWLGAATRLPTTAYNGIRVDGVYKWAAGASSGAGGLADGGPRARLFLFEHVRTADLSVHADAGPDE